MSWKQRFQFLGRFIMNPKRIGSITPSSRFLVNAMSNSIPWAHVNTIVELGAGTGAFTAQMEQQMKQNCQGFIFEQDPLLFQKLRQRYPRLIHCLDAKLLQAELMKHRVNQVDCIVSSLPFANFSDQERTDLILKIKRTLSINGIFIAYQYSLQMKEILQHHFQMVKIKFIPFNLPPSFVYICK